MKFNGGLRNLMLRSLKINGDEADLHAVKLKFNNDLLHAVKLRLQ